MFLEIEQEKANKEIDCYGYLLKKAIELMAKGEFGKAAIYHQNITRSLEELDRMKRNKQTSEEVNLLLKQIQSDQQQKQLLFKMAVNIYE